MTARYTAGSGAILMFHRVRHRDSAVFAPNSGLEITPEFLDTCLSIARDCGLEIVTMDEARRRLVAQDNRRFAVLTFDDGYRDILTDALPVLERHDAPFTVYVTTGFVDRIAPLWWVDLETAIARLPEIRLKRTNFDCRTVKQKYHVFNELYWDLRSGSEERLRAVVHDLATLAEVDSQAIAQQLCLDWTEISHLARNPLCTIGVHTVTHPILAKHPAELVRQELVESRRLIEGQIGRRAGHLAYPIGDRTSTGAREIAIAGELGFDTAVTTRKGMLFPAHVDALHALPRLSVNGFLQTPTSLEVLLSGLPFFLLNRGRRVMTI